MAGMGTTGIVLIVLVALILFGPSKLPELGRAFGRTLKEFKNGTKELMGGDDSISKAGYGETPHLTAEVLQADRKNPARVNPHE